MTSYRRRCDVNTSHLRPYDVSSTSCAGWVIFKNRFDTFTICLYMATSVLVCISNSWYLKVNHPEPENLLCDSSRSSCAQNKRYGLLFLSKYGLYNSQQQTEVSAIIVFPYRNLRRIRQSNERDGLRANDKVALYFPLPLRPRGYGKPLQNEE